MTQEKLTKRYQSFAAFEVFFTPIYEQITTILLHLALC